MKLIIQTYSTTGIRSQNEDAIDINNNLNNNNNLFFDMCYCAIFDGHGGGEISKTLVDPTKIFISKYFCKKTSPLAEKLYNKPGHEKNIIDAFSHIQEKLKNYFIKSNKMGSTSLISLIYPKNNKFRLKIINLGDCRAVLCSGYNIAHQLSLDHKPNNYCEKKRIIDLGGVIEYSLHDDPRINGMSVSRSFGDLDNKFISQVPDIFDYTITNDKFLIIACDGVWDVLSNQEAVDCVLEKNDELKTTNKPLQNMRGKSENNIAQKLAELALLKGTTDNLSVVIIFLQ